VFASQGAEQTQEIKVLMDGIQLGFDVEPQIENGRTLVPFRRIAEALNVEVSWDELDRCVIADNGDISVRMPLDSQYAWINKSRVTMDAAPLLINGRTQIPARFFSEVFGCKVEWIADSSTVKITSPPQVMKVTAFYALGDKMTSSWTDLFEKAYPESEQGNTGVVSDLALGWYSMDEKGKLLTKSSTGWQRPDGWEKVVETAARYKMDTQMLIHMTDGKGRLIRLLNDEKAVNQAIDSITKEVCLYNGVNLDFEGLGWNDSIEELDKTQAVFNNFVEKLSLELKKQGKELTLTLHAPNTAYLGYDYETLGRVADHIIIMAYDYGTQPEPDGLVCQALDMVISFVPADKILLGISAVSETPESLINKIGIAKKYNLEGIAIWRLGLLSDGMWKVVKDNVIKPVELLAVRGEGTYELYHQPEPKTLLSTPEQLHGGDRVQVIRQQGQWSEVKKGQLEGWISSWYLEIGDEVLVKDIEPEYMVVKQNDVLYLNPDGEAIGDYDIDNPAWQIVRKGRLVEVTKHYADWRYINLMAYSIPATSKGWVKAEILTDPTGLIPSEGYLPVGTEIYEGENGDIKTHTNTPMAVFIGNREKDGLVEIGAAGGWTARENIQFVWLTAD
ncbi:MAG: stalk domain-containing protein, partial [Bacillota bacterium]|nr:stalk domain-containing protein [Bacillota bacterium]